KIFVREIKQFLIVGVGVHGGHGAGNDAEGVVQDFGDGREAIRGAGSVRDHVMLRRVVGFVVHAEDEGVVWVGGGGGDDHFFHRAANVLARVGACGEEAGGFDDDGGADGGPVELGGILHAEDFDGLAVHGDG